MDDGHSVKLRSTSETRAQVEAFDLSLAIMNHVAICKHEKPGSAPSRPCPGSDPPTRLTLSSGRGCLSCCLPIPPPPRRASAVGRRVAASSVLVAVGRGAAASAAAAAPRVVVDRPNEGFDPPFFGLVPFVDGYPPSTYHGCWKSNHPCIGM